MTFVLARYAGAAICARLADEGARVAVLLLVLERTGETALGGFLIAMLMVPHVVAAPPIGALADRVRRRRVLYVAAFLAYAACLAGGAVLIGRSTIGAAAVLVAAGCVAPLLIGGLTSLLGELAGYRLERAFGLDATTYGVAGIAGPALAAVVAGLAGAAWSMIALGGLVAAGSLLVATLPLRARPVDAERAAGAGPGAAFRAMVRRRGLGAVTAGSVLNQIGLGALPVVAALLASRAEWPGLTGVVMSVAAAGGLAGSLLCTRFPIRRPPETVAAVCLAATAVPFLILAFLPAGWAGLSFFAVAGALGAPLFIAVFAVRDRDAPPQARTQVFTLGAGLKVTGAAAGAALAGLAAPAGLVVLMLAMAACQIAGALVVLLVGRAAAPVTPAVGCRS